MAIDSNIALQGQPTVQLQNPLDVAAKAMSLKSLARQNQIADQQFQTDQATRAAFQKNLQPGPDGTPQLNRAGVLSDLAQVDPMKAMDLQRQFQQQDQAAADQKLKALTDHANMAKDLAWSINDEASYQAARQKGIQLGLPNAESMPPTYDPNYVKNLKMITLSANEQLAQANKDREFQQKAQELAIKRQQAGASLDDKQGKDLEKTLSTGWAARGGQAGKVQAKINAAEAAEALISQGKSQPGGLDSRQIEELAQSTSTLLGGGTQASARVEALVPHTLLGRAQTLREYLSNNPQGAEQQAFVDRMAETVAREKALAQNQMRQFQIESLPAHDALKRRNPNLYNNILSAKGIDPSMIDEKGRYKAPAPAGTVQMRDPQGNIRAVPADQVEAAKAAGGVPL